MVPARGGVGGQPLIAAISGPVPRICITRFIFAAAVHAQRAADFLRGLQLASA